MTKPRWPGSFCDAISRACGALTYEEAAKATDKSTSLLRQAGDPDCDVMLTLPVAFALDRAYAETTGDDPPILTVYHQAMAAALEGQEHAPADPLHRVSEMARETGEAAHAYAQCRNGDPTSQLQRMEAIREIREARAVLEQAERDLTAESVVKGGAA